MQTLDFRTGTLERTTNSLTSSFCISRPLTGWLRSLQQRQRSHKVRYEPSLLSVRPVSLVSLMLHSAGAERNWPHNFQHEHLRVIRQLHACSPPESG